ncbi:MAG TPA: hypothetical protein VHZ97_26755 [Pseudonocardiaceae bacterium]|jgi:hypothetical protein|nr:hypothetical protein [Pseudonocardiaceae bacterium]
MKPEDSDDANNEDDIDADLRALFADQRLCVPVGDDAVSSVVAGASRRRRRRTVVLATSGALGVAAVLLAGGLFAGQVFRPGQVQTAHQPSLPTTGYLTITSAPPATSAQRAGPEPEVSTPTVLGPTGYGPITMGLSKSQLLDTKLVDTTVSAVGGCADYTYVGPTLSRPSAAATEQGNKSIHVYLSPRAPQGVQEIIAPPGVTTPEGIGVGSSVSQLRAMYAKLPAQQGDLLLVPVPDHPELSYRFTLDKDTVTTIGLGLANEICLGH